ncbi:hypothetical protein ACWC5I_40985 [Kitasatospora sp. NPDC001574]
MTTTSVQADKVFLIDLENMIGANATLATFAPRFAALLAAAGSGCHPIAAGTSSRIIPAVKKAMLQHGTSLLLDFSGRELPQEGSNLHLNKADMFGMAGGDVAPVARMGDLCSPGPARGSGPALVWFGEVGEAPDHPAW